MPTGSTGSLSETDDTLEGFRGFSDDNGEFEEYCRQFNRAAKVFRGFPHDDGRSARYVRKFKRMVEDRMDPVVVLERLSSTVFSDEQSRRGRRSSDYLTVEPNAAIEKRPDAAVVLNENKIRCGKRREVLRVPAISSDEVSEAEARRCLNFSSEPVSAEQVDHVETSGDKSPLYLNDPYIKEPVGVVKSRECRRLWLQQPPCSVTLKCLPHAQRVKEPDVSVKYPVVFDADLQKSEAPQRLAEIDLSNGLILRSLCQLKSIDIDDSDDERRPEIICISSDDEPDPLDVVEELEAVSENPIPSGVEALTELGFLDNESFQFGKDPKAENIWSDVLNFSELDDSCVENPIEVDAISSKVTISRRFDSCLETVDGKDSNVFESLLSDKELLISDPLNCNNLDMKVNPVDHFGGPDCLISLINHEKLKKTLDDAKENDSNDTIVQARKRRTSQVDDGKEGIQIKSIISLQQSNRRVKHGTLQMDRQSRAMEYSKKTQWMTQMGKNDVTSAELYRDLSAIPYVLKCNIQNRSRRCHSLYPCANANKDFKLFFTVTIGGGRKLSQSLLNAIRTEDTIIDRTSAYIAASAVLSKPTTVLIPAEPETICKVIPIQHANLLMQLFNETEERRKREKKSVSDMAIVEMLKFKRFLMEMKPTSLPRSPSPERSPQKTIKPSTRPRWNISPQKPIKPPPCLKVRQKLVKPTKPSTPQLHKTNQIIAVNTVTDNKFQFLKNSMVSLIRDSGHPHLKGKSLLQKRPHGSEAQVAAPPLKKVHVGSAGLAANGIRRASRSSSCTGRGSMDSENSGRSWEESEGLGPLNKASPNVVSIPGEIESIDLTQEDHKLPEWGAVCPAFPELGFVSVQKRLGKLLLCDKSIVPQTVEFDNIFEMGVYLSSRIVNLLRNVPRSKMSQQWVLVSSGFVNQHNISPTSAQFWVSPQPKNGTLSIVPSPLRAPQGSGFGISGRSTDLVVYKPPGKLVQLTASTSTTCVVTTTTSTAATSLPSSTCLIPSASFRPNSDHSVPAVPVTTQSLQVAVPPRTSAATTCVVVPSVRCPSTRQPILPSASRMLRSITYGLSPAASSPRKPPKTIGVPLLPAESLSKSPNLTSLTIPVRSPTGPIVVRRVSSQPLALPTAPTVNTQLPRNRPILIVRNSSPNTTSCLSKIFVTAPKTKLTH